MLQKLIEFCLTNRFLVLVLVGLMAAAGVRSALELPIAAVPDMTNVQVTVITNAGSLSPVEVEQYVTFPVEATMRGLPNVEEMRSVSKFGISVVTVVFEEGTDIYFARQMVTERLPIASAKLPAGYGTPEIGPLTTALGEILQFQVVGAAYTSMQLRTMLEWEIAPKLREVEGVTEINTHGGFYKTYEIQPDPDRLASYNIALDEVFRRVQENNGSSGGGYVVHNREQRFIRAEALLKTVSDIENVVIRRDDSGVPILLSDIATVSEEPMTRQGAVTRDGKGEAVTGLVMMLVGQNSREVVGRVKERIAEVIETLPTGVSLEVIYDRSDLIGRTLHTVEKNLIEGGILVVVILLLMLGSLRAGLIVAMAIPLSMLFAANLMYLTAISASLMSLGAIDFGLIVDSSVIMVENCMHRLAHGAKGVRNRLAIIRDACIEVRKPTLFGELIISVVYIPVLLLQGTEGKLFRPMALTVLFALFGSLILSMTLMPVLAAIALPRNLKSGDVWIIRWLKLLYQPAVTRAIAKPRLTASIALVVFGLSIPIAMNLGAEFMPRLEEGDLLVEAVRLPTATIEGATEMSTAIEKILLEFPEVRTTFCKTGRPEIANDVMGVHQTDVWVILKHADEWRAGLTREDLINAMDESLSSRVPGVAFGFTQPIEMRVDELVAGVKSDVAVMLYGEDLDILAKKSKEIEGLLQTIDGSADVRADIQANLQTLSIVPDREALAAYGLNATSVLDVVETIGGKDVGTVIDGRARFPIRVRVPATWRNDLELIEQLPVAAVGEKLIPLHELADISMEETPPSVEHDNARRRTFVAANVRGRDVAGFVDEAKRRVEEQIELPAGYEIQWGGDFENLQSASLRLMLITPIVLLLILILLHTSLGSISLALLIFLAVPMAASGGVYALALRDLPFSISAGVGFIALFGVAVLNGLVWVSSAENSRLRGDDMNDVTQQTALDRLRPVLMTALVASFGFIPMALSNSDGAEMQRPLATVVIGGLVTSTLLTTFVIPAIYPWFAPKTIKMQEDHFATEEA